MVCHTANHLNAKFSLTENQRDIMKKWLLYEKEHPKVSRFIPGYGNTHSNDDDQPIWPFSAV